MDNKETNYAYLIDLINILSFIIGLQNLDMNDKQVTSLDEHLTTQDQQYEKIINLLEDLLQEIRKENKDGRKD